MTSFQNKIDVIFDIKTFFSFFLFIIKMSGKQWVFTLNEDESHPFSRTETPVDIWRPDQMDYLVFSMEKGTHVHLQGYCAFSKVKRFNAAKKLLGGDRVHLEPARGRPDQNRAYCTKMDETHLLGPWEWGTLPLGKGHRSDLDAAVADITSGKPLAVVAATHPVVYTKYARGLSMLQTVTFPSPAWRDLHVTWVWGKPGVGKTRMAYDSDPDLYKLIMPGLWWDFYDRQKTLLIDDFYGQLKCSDMLNILDGYKLQLPVKGGFTWAHWTRVYITSNVAPTEIYKNSIPSDVLAAFYRRIHEIINLA